MKKQLNGIAPLLVFLALAALACGLTEIGEEGPPSDAVVVDIVANTSLRPYLHNAVTQFNEAEIENEAGFTYFAMLRDVESGEAVTDLAGGQASASLWIPDDPVWVDLLADQGNGDFQGNCQSIAESPLIIGMWRPVAESLGWPGLPLGWLDIGSLAADPAAWDYYSGGEFGDSFRLGHTHPGLSASGVSTLLALVQAAQAKTDAVTVEDIQQPIVQASVGAFEGGVTWFSNSTLSLAATMSERDISYLGAAIMYENTIVEYGGEGEIVAVYPLEGTFVATHPACVNQSLGTEAQEAAVAFRDFLLSEDGQQLALSHGLRPVSDAVPLGPPIDEAHGVNPDQPEIVFAPPSVETVYAVQELWQQERKNVNLVMLLDVSGSMRGSKMSNMQEAAAQFAQQMGEGDFITLIAFETEPFVVIEHVPVGPNRQKIANAIQDLRVGGDTTLFDAIGDGADVVDRTHNPELTNVMVVLTDGQDTRSYRYDFNDALIEKATAHDTTVFTIAYGDDADQGVLEKLATSANGNFYLGDEASIAAIYDEMSAAFGGSVGVGR